MRLQESGEMYLEAILVLNQKQGHVRSIDVSEYLGYSKPSVSRAVGLLKNGGYLVVEDDGGLTLTDAGREIGEKIYQRHTVLTELLLKLGVSRDVAAEDACKLEHAVSDESFYAIKKLVFEEKKLSLSQFINIINNNFKENSELRNYIINKLRNSCRTVLK